MARRVLGLLAAEHTMLSAVRSCHFTVPPYRNDTRTGCSRASRADGALRADTADIRNRRAARYGFRVCSLRARHAGGVAAGRRQYSDHRETRTADVAGTSDYVSLLTP